MRIRPRTRVFLSAIRPYLLPLLVLRMQMFFWPGLRWWPAYNTVLMLGLLQGLRQAAAKSRDR